MAWKPKFRTMTSIEKAADLINQPHEDYPYRVSDTAKCIHGLLQAGVQTINEVIVKGVHSQIMPDKSFRGKWRDMQVTVDGNEKLSHTLIESALIDVLPYCAEQIYKPEDIMQWYYDFEMIHPFQDGNGRVGGVCVVVLSYLFNDGSEILVPDDNGPLTTTYTGWN